MQQILLKSNGNVYRLKGDDLIEIHDARLGADPYSHFFKTPYKSASYILHNKIVDSFKIHPSSFYPGSPFDMFKAIELYYKDNKVVFPKVYLYPSGMCNARCPICQFYNLNRFSGGGNKYIDFDSIRRIAEGIGAGGNELRAVSVNVSGDGEPTTHPDFTSILELLGRKGVRIFLTSNLILPNSADAKLEAIARHVSMITVSIKGLSENAYAKNQGVDGWVSVMAHLKKLIALLHKLGRRNDVLVGVATLLLPENTNHYEEAVKMFTDLGVDYLYLNPVEPSYEKWGIRFSQEEQNETLRFLNNLKNIDCGQTIVRYPGDFRPDRPGKKVYYNASARANREICGSALWNPAIITSDTESMRGARILSCRSSQNFNNDEFWFADNFGESDVSAVVMSNVPRVMAATEMCDECRLERQVKMYDYAISIVKKYNFRGEFALVFNEADLTPRGKAITFEETV